MKKFGNFIYWVIVITLATWMIASFIDVNHANVTEAEIEPWNLFELAMQFEEATH